MFSRSWSEILAVLQVLTLVIGKAQSFYPHTVKNRVAINENFLVRRFKVRDWMSCVVACQDEPACFSYNYQYIKKENGLCELLKCGVDQQKGSEDELLYSYGFVFQQLKEHEKMKRCLTGCLIGWTSFRSHCYKAIDQGMTWQRASQYCRDNGGNLTSIHFEEENQFLVQSMGATFPKSEFWIGLKPTENRCSVASTLWYSDGTANSHYSAFHDYKCRTCLSARDCFCVKVLGNEWFYTSCKDELSFVCKT